MTVEELEEKLTQLGEQLGATDVGLEAFVRGRDRSTYREYLLTHDRTAAPLAEADQSDRAALGRQRYGLSGLALQFFVENAPEKRAAITKPQEAKRPPTKPKGTPAPRIVKLREADDESALTELFAAMGMSDSAATIAAKGRDR